MEQNIFRAEIAICKTRSTASVLNCCRHFWSMRFWGLRSILWLYLSLRDFWNTSLEALVF